MRHNAPPILTYRRVVAAYQYFILALTKLTTMTKAQLVKSIAKETGIDGKTTEFILDTAIDTIKKSLIVGDNVTLRMFGTFSRQHRKSKIGRDITHGTSVEIPAHYVPKFKPAREFADAVATGE